MKQVKILDYIRRTPEVRDVLLSGGDPFMLSDDYLEWILSEVRSMRLLADYEEDISLVPENNKRMNRRKNE